jgi:hypothetical protein
VTATLEPARASRRAAAVSWALAGLSACALAVGGLLLYAERTLFDPDAFADRAEAAFTLPAVRDAAAGRVGDVVIAAKPDLVVLRPLLELGARQLVGAAPFRALVRAAALDAHRSAFDQHRREVAVRVTDAGVLLAAALRRLDPRLEQRVPVRVVTRLVRIKGGLDGWLLRGAEASERVRRARWPALVAALLLAAGALLFTDSRRAAVLRLGVAVALVAAVVVAATLLAPGLVAGGLAGRDRAAVEAVLGIWLDPLRTWAAAAGGLGLVAALAAAAVARPLPVRATLRRTAAWTPQSPRGRVARAALALAVGAALVASPRRALTVAAVAVGALVVAAAAAELLGLAAGAEGARAPRRGGSVRRGARVGAAAAVLATGIALAAAVASGDTPVVPRLGRCNGHAALCNRPLDRVAFLGTHNSMAAASEPGWLFAAQGDGIAPQLDAGVRALLIDTHYGFATRRGVLTDLQGHSLAARAGDEADRVVATAERLRKRIAAAPEGKREIFLCHTFCELGATRGLDALRVLHEFLVRHPDEVVLLSIQDETSAADTAQLIRESGLAGEVYRGDARPPWPTLRELIDRDQRLVVFAENDHGGPPWLLAQPKVMQETPYHFGTEQALAAPASCDPNRGGTAGSLLLVNHWVDTSPAPRVSIARRVNAREFLERRLERCRRTRAMLPNIVAVDFYREGDAAPVVDELNGVR